VNLTSCRLVFVRFGVFFFFCGWARAFFIFVSWRISMRKTELFLIWNQEYQICIQIRRKRSIGPWPWPHALEGCGMSARPIRTSGCALGCNRAGPKLPDPMIRGTQADAFRLVFIKKRWLCFFPHGKQSAICSCRWVWVWV
jgi:hypothetical protein